MLVKLVKRRWWHHQNLLCVFEANVCLHFHRVYEFWQHLNFQMVNWAKQCILWRFFDSVVISSLGIRLLTQHSQLQFNILFMIPLHAYSEVIILSANKVVHKYRDAFNFHIIWVPRLDKHLCCRTFKKFSNFYNKYPRILFKILCHTL